MNSLKVVPVIVVTLGVAVALLVALRELSPPPGSAAEAFASQASANRLEPLFSAPDFRFTDQHGQEVTKASLAGQVWVANFIFTTCRTVCPLLTSKFVRLQRRLPDAKVRFVSFSVDPAHDTPEVLAAYAQRWAPDEARWTLLATGEATLPPLAAGFHVTAMKGTDEVDPILHSALFLLVDQQGVVRGIFHSEEQADFEALERSLLALSGSAAPKGRALPTTGPGLYHELSCANCHERPELAPPLAAVAGRRRELDTGLVVTGDAAYVRESILAPDAKRVRGYPLRMPGYEGLLDAKALETLVSWTLGLAAAAAAAGGGSDGGDDGVSLEVDPVCHMKVRATADALQAERDGGRVYFCSEYCRDRFLAGPGAVAPAPAPTTR